MNQTGYYGQPPPPGDTGLYPQPPPYGMQPNYPQAGADNMQPKPVPNNMQPMAPVNNMQPVSQVTTMQPMGTVNVQPVAVGMQPMMVPGSTVIVQQQARKPENYMILAVLVTFFCNCPLGVIAWIFSCLSDSSYDDGNVDEARSRGKTSMWLSIAGVIISVLLIIIIPIIVVTTAASAVVDYSSRCQDDWRYC